MEDLEESQKKIAESGCLGRVYLAGPMTGLPEYNFPAFHEAAKRWRAAGWEVVNPAEMDEDLDGFDSKTDKAKSHEHYMRRDIPAVAGCTAIALLQGWENSKGARNELTAAKWFGCKVYSATTMREILCEPTRENLLRSTEKVVYGDRQKDYGPAKENHERIAAIWSVILGCEVAWQQVVQCMVGVKLARLVQTPDHRDSYVDIAGYAAVWDKAQHGE